ncbi:MAG: alpha/beta fold hydrolase [Microbacteriaceae bacterium]
MNASTRDPSLAEYLVGCQTHIVHGERWHHRIIEYGDGGIPFVFVHGSNGHAEVFAKNLRSLGRERRVIALDALYHGLSSKEPWIDGYYNRIEVQAEGLADLLNALGIERVILEGESMGAGVCLEFAMRWPERVECLIMCTGCGSVDIQGSTYMQRLDEESDFSLLSREVAVQPTFNSMRKRLEWLVASPESVTDDLVGVRLQLYSVPEVRECMRRMSQAGDDAPHPKYTEDDLQNLVVPTLVLWTDQNPGDGPEVGKHLSELIPHARFEVIRDAGHWPHWERPEEHDARVRQFIVDAAGGNA